MSSARRRRAGELFPVARMGRAGAPAYGGSAGVGDAERVCDCAGGQGGEAWKQREVGFAGVIEYDYVIASQDRKLDLEAVDGDMSEEYKIFISWSGEQSKWVADAMYE